MFRLESEITIRGAKTWQFSAVHHCEIVEDTQSLTDTCTIVLPKKISWEGFEGLNLPIKRGDAISVKLGYAGYGLETRFSGYVRTIDAKTPMTITCEDGMFLLKTIEAKKKGYAKVGLNELITDLLAGTGIKHRLIEDDIVLGPYRVTKNTVAEELNEMRNEFGLRAYFRHLDGKDYLYVGFQYPFDARKKGRFVFGENIISEDFVYRISEDVRVKVKAISIDDANVRIETTVGDKDGELYTVYQYNADRDTLRRFAESELKRFKTTGFKGSFETFGMPMVRKCDIAYVKAMDNNEGNFLIKKVVTKFGIESGYKQKIALAQPIDLNSNGN